MKGVYETKEIWTKTGEKNVPVREYENHIIVSDFAILWNNNVKIPLKQIVDLMKQSETKQKGKDNV